MNKPTSPLTAVIYVRVSSEKQIDGYSLDAQTKILKKYAQANGMKVLRIFREEGKSGRFKSNRPEYLEMLRFIKENSVDVVLSHKLDRMSRTECDTFNDMEYIVNNLGTRYIAVGESMDSADEDFRLKMGIQAVINAQFSRNLAKETRKGLLAGAENCQHMGGKPPYGFTVNRDTGLLEIDETTAPAVRQIFTLYADGFTTSEICNWLKEHGYKTSKGNDFKGNSLNAILHNEKYRGCYIWDKATPKNTDGHRNSHAVKDEYIKIEGGCPAIVSDALFAAAQERLAENRSKKSRAKPKRYYSLNGRIYCSECGSRMTGNVQYSSGKRYYQYRCSGNCGSKAIRAEMLEASVLRTLEQALFSAPNREAILDALNQSAADHKHDCDTVYQQLKSKEFGLHTSQMNLMNAVETGKATSAIMNRLDRISGELVQIETKLQSLDRSVHTFTEADLSELQARFVAYMKDNGNVNAKRLLNSTIGKVEVGNTQVQITLADGISVDRETKIQFIKKGNMVKKMTTMKTDAILLSAKETKNAALSLRFMLRQKNACGYESECRLTVPEETFFALAADAEMGLHQLFGERYTITFTVDNDKITGVSAIEVA